MQRRVCSDETYAKKRERPSPTSLTALDIFMNEELTNSVWGVDVGTHLRRRPDSPELGIVDTTRGRGRNKEKQRKVCVSRVLWIHNPIPQKTNHSEKDSMILPTEAMEERYSVQDE